MVSLTISVVLASENLYSTREYYKEAFIYVSHEDSLKSPKVHCFVSMKYQ